ncbi:MAG: hypothetical protein ISP32_08175 [Thermoleophilia bacterium]|nr:hypothetical protein [Thermoleophilia bacterium]
MTIHTRIAWAVACATLLPMPAVALANDAASIRAEGPDATVLPERLANVPTGGTSTLVDPTSGETTVVPNNRGTSFLLRSAEAAGVSVGFRVYNFGTPSALITRIGPVASPTDWSWSWKLKVNHRETSVGSDDVVIRPGDEILWMPSVYGVPDSELDVVGPGAPSVVGEAVTVRVDRYDDAGVRTPAGGVTLAYGGQSVTTGPDGTATLATLPGWGDVVATAPHPGGVGTVRDSGRVCGFTAGRPEECGLDPLATRLPDVTPNADISSEGPLRVSATVDGRVISLDVPVPVRGQRPVTISPAGLGDGSLTPVERRAAAGRLASSVAWELNQRTAQGDTAVTPPRGTRWRAAWTGSTTTVAPLAAGEALVRVRPRSRKAATIDARTARVATKRLADCGLGTRARVATRFGYAMVVIASPARGGRACLARGRG